MLECTYNAFLLLAKAGDAKKVLTGLDCGSIRNDRKHGHTADLDKCVATVFDSVGFDGLDGAAALFTARIAALSAARQSAL
jgi:hypothetical protein